MVAIEGAKMGQKSGSVKESAKQVVKEIRRVTRRQFSAEEKIRIVLTGLRGEDSIAELCRREGTSRTEAPPNWWTPLLSSGGSGKVSNGPGTASFYG
jgi:transposase-like protein